MIQEANLTWRYIDTESNLILPWYTKPALEWLKQQDVSQWKIFEYGAGYSTIWWNLNSKESESIDSDMRWAIAMSCLHGEDKDAYVQIIRQFPDRDCIIVDGDWRDVCVVFCIQSLKSGGHLIIDNWGQGDFPPAYCDMADDLLKGWDKKLFKQPNHSTWITAIFTKP
jgi:hypothetical protein